MHERVLRLLDAEDLSMRAALLPATSPAQRRRGLVIGFDTEWGATKELLSVQFAAMIEGRPVARVYDAPATRLSVQALVVLVSRFISDVHIELPAKKLIRVYLTAHFAQAELSMLEDALRDASIATANKAHFASLPATEHVGRWWALRVVDLYAIYNMSLAKVGDAVGLPKVELEQHEKQDMARLRADDPAKFKLYAARDAEIAVLAMEQLRRELLSVWGVDPLAYRTVASIALAIFRHHFLGSDAPIPFRVERRCGKDIAVVTLARVRRMALAAYWGGRNEAYVRGVYRGAVVDLDVRSMYPHAALLQPLPQTNTRWMFPNSRRSAPIDHEWLLRLEGFATVDFEFPRDCRYPCLPCARVGVEKLYFPLRGTSHCTLSELRAARDLGADFRVVDYCAFEPGSTECEHALGKYLRHFLAEKDASPEGSLRYRTNKLLLNALIGKFAERVEPDLTTTVEKTGRLHGVPGLAALLTSSLATGGALRGRPRVGSGWTPEWAALILGRARALMAHVVSSTRALLVSTDGVVAPAECVSAAATCSAVQELRSVGSDLEEKASAAALWVGRERLYAVLNVGDDGTFVAVKVARHGMPGTDAEATEDILASLAAGKSVAKRRTRTRLASAPEAARRGLRVNAEVTEERTAAFKWDAKRRLLDRDAKVFSGLSDTAPYATLGGVAKAEIAREKKRAVEHVARRRHARPTVERAIHLLRVSTDLSLSDIARETKTSKSWVGALKQRMMRGEEVFWKPAAPREVKPLEAIDAAVDDGAHDGAARTKRSAAE